MILLKDFCSSSCVCKGLGVTANLLLAKAGTQHNCNVLHVCILLTSGKLLVAAGASKVILVYFVPCAGQMPTVLAVHW